MHFEGLSGAVNVSVVAFSIVFGVLFILTMVIFGMKLFAGSGDEKKNDTVTPKPASAPSSASVSKSSNADKAKIVAAITAAIIEFSGSPDFRILSIEADKGRDYWTSRWKTAGMINLNSNRLNRAWK